jgi:hypothetical protein
MTNRPTGSRPVATGNPNLIRQDIERTRGDLGDTMDALAGKADVKARTREATDRAKTQARQRVTTGARRMQHRSGELTHKATEGVQRVRQRPVPVATAATAAGAAAAAGTIIFLRRRRAARAQARQRLWRLSR